MNNKTFLKIPNKFFEIKKNEINEEIEQGLFYLIGTEGFAIWSYLLLTQGNQVAAQTNIKRIRVFLNRDKDTRKKHAKNGLYDYRTIKKYLDILLKMKMISMDEDEEDKMKTFKDVRADEELFIQVNDCCNDKDYYSAISTKLFYDNIHKMGHIGWAIYCLLFKSHNINFGGDTVGNIGFANCSEDYIAHILNRSRKTVSEYIKNMPKGLIIVQPQAPVVIFNPRTNADENKYLPNHVIVNAKCNSENKYYIETSHKAAS